MLSMSSIALQETQAAVAGVRPLRVEIEQRRGDLGLAVGVDRAVALVERAADRHQGGVLRRDSSMPSRSPIALAKAGAVMSLDQRVDRRAAVARRRKGKKPALV